MCGRYYIATEEELIEMREIIEEVARNLGVSPAEAAVKAGEVFPTDILPVLAPAPMGGARSLAGERPGGDWNGNGRRPGGAWDGNGERPGGGLPGQAGLQWRLAKWGFPHWQAKRPIINARSETVAQKPMFRRAFQTSRCAVPAAGFYEWKRVGGKSAKEKYLLKRADGQMLYMAGLAEMFRGEGAGEGAGTYEAFAIITTEANESVADIHDRMPVILAREELGMWVRDMAFAEDALRRPGPELARIAA